MKRLLFIIQKEFIQIFRNKAILPLITVVPILQLILLSYAASNEVKKVNLAIVDQDVSSYSRRLVNKIRMSDRFGIIDARYAESQVVGLMEKGEVDIILQFPSKFETDFHKGKEVSLRIEVNAINGQGATIGFSYLNSIIQSFNQEIQGEVKILPVKMLQGGIDIEHSYWYNSELNFQHFMVPGILGELVTILVMLLTAMNVVREREVGTIEQINVTPIKNWQFILGKMVPFLVIGMLLMTVGLIAGKLIFDVPMRGNLALVFAFCAVNITAVLGLGLFISNLVDTQQQAMFVAFFFVIIFILMSGLFTPIESMPEWAQYLTLPNPIAHFVEVMRKVLLKGSDFADIVLNFRATVILSIIFNALAVMSYRKVD
ncbi:MAG: ABC transporter permease [Bacteroidota bacterium]